MKQWRPTGHVAEDVVQHDQVVGREGRQGVEVWQSLIRALLFQMALLLAQAAHHRRTLGQQTTSHFSQANMEIFVGLFLFFLGNDVTSDSGGYFCLQFAHSENFLGPFHARECVNQQIFNHRFLASIIHVFIVHNSQKLCLKFCFQYLTQTIMFCL